MQKIFKKTRTRKHRLARKLGFGFVILYGLGNIVGAGIYALIGTVAGEAGYATPLVFLITMGVAMLSGLSFAELASRHPFSEGASAYAHAAFRRKWIALVVGGLMFAGTVVSAAALARAFGGYFVSIVNLPIPLVAATILLVFGLLVMRGISESVWAAVAFTAAEVFGLGLIIWFGFSKPAVNVIPIQDFFVPEVGIAGLLAASFLAFYAYIGIEDMVHLAEETKKPRTNLPKAIVAALVIATLLYVPVAVVTLRTIALPELAASTAPLTLVFRSLTTLPPIIITLIALSAVSGGVLSHVISGSRVLYGMAEAGWLHRHLAYVHEKTKTPRVAIVVIVGLAIVATLLFDLKTLAAATSFLILIIFGIINLGLIVIKARRGKKPEFSVPMLIPILGTLSIAGLLVSQILSLVYP